jgi:hypothetical protein
VAAGQPYFHRQIEQDTEVGLQSTSGVLLNWFQLVKVDAVPTALVGIGGIDVPIADDPGSTSQRRSDNLAHMLSACGGQHEYFGLRENSIVTCAETEQERRRPSPMRVPPGSRVSTTSTPVWRRWSARVRT